MNIHLRRILCQKSKLNQLLNCWPKSGQTLCDYNYCRNYSTDLQSYGNVFFRLSQSIATSDLVNSAKDAMISLHEWTGISWALEIALITFAVRSLITFPLSISQQKILNKYQSLTPEMNDFSNRLQKEIISAQYLYNWSPIKARLMHTYRTKQEMKRLIIRDNCHPMKASIVVWFQMPFWIIFSHSIRNMSFMYPNVDQKSQLVYNQLSNEGFLWFSDLTQTDPYFVLPFITAIINLCIVELHSRERLRRMNTKTRMHTIMTNIGRTVSVILIPVGLQMPSAVCFYWFTSSSLGLLQNIVLYSNQFKQTFRLK